MCQKLQQQKFTNFQLKNCEKKGIRRKCNQHTLSLNCFRYLKNVVRRKKKAGDNLKGVALHLSLVGQKSV